MESLYQQAGGGGYNWRLASSDVRLSLLISNRLAFDVYAGGIRLYLLNTFQPHLLTVVDEQCISCIRSAASLH